MAEENLVDVDFQNLVFIEVLLDFQRQQCLVELAPKGAFARQEKVARHLHGNRGSPLTTPARSDVADRRAQHADRIDATVCVKAGIFRGEDCFLQYIRYLRNIYDRTPFLAELAQQRAIRSIDAHRNAGAVVREAFQRRQLRPGVGDGCDYPGCANDNGGDQKQE